MRFVRADDGTVWMGGEVQPADADADGVIEGPGGELLRQVVDDDACCWTSSTWIDRAGVAYQRYRLPATGACRFGPMKMPTLDPGGALMVQVGGGGRPRAVRVARAIGLAWISAPRLLCKLQMRQVADGELCADNLAWVRQTTKAVSLVEGAAISEGRPRADDEWVTLRYTWRFRNGDPVARFDATRHGEYAVSSRGWFRTPAGDVTRGHRTPSGRRWASVRGEGAVWLDEAVLYAFRGSPAEPSRPRHLNDDLSDNAVPNLRWELTQFWQSHAALVCSREAAFPKQFRRARVATHQTRRQRVP